jgi:TolB-like protein/Tfp pilus assembly protein PilF
MKNSEKPLKTSRAADQSLYEFADLRLDLARRFLDRNGQEVRLHPKAFDALALLVEHRNELLTKDALIQQLWPNLAVEDNSLARVISDLRKALGEAGSCVITVARRGYRLEADVRTVQRQTESPVAVDRKTLAVLPFAAFGSSEADRMLAFGMADALITRLSHLAAIVVRPTTSIARYVESTISPARIGRELKADFVLCGTVRKSGTQVRLTVQLIDAAVEGTLWAGQFDEQITDLFAIEDSVSERIVASLALQLTRSEKLSLAQRCTHSTQAYELYMYGRLFQSRRTGEALLRAIDYFKRAIDLDPDFALAHAGIGEAGALLSLASATVGAVPPRQTIPAARAAAIRALIIDNRLSEAHAALAQIKLAFDWDWPAAEQGFVRALQLNPNNVLAHGFYSIGLVSVGCVELALREVTVACELEPTSLVYRTNVGFILHSGGRLAEAIEQLRECAALDPSFAYTRYRYGHALEQAGQYEEALAQFDAMLELPNAAVQALASKGHVLAKMNRRIEALDVLARLIACSPQQYVSAYFLAQIHAALGNSDQAFVALDQAYEERPVMMISLMNDPKLNPLRGDSRFNALVDRVGLWASPA